MSSWVDEEVINDSGHHCTRTGASALRHYCTRTVATTVLGRAPTTVLGVTTILGWPLLY